MAPQKPNEGAGPKTTSSTDVDSQPQHSWEDATLSSEYLMEAGIKSLQWGGVMGGAGTLVGAGFGITRNVPPVLFGVAAGFQWFALGSTFTASRLILRPSFGGLEKMRPGDHAMVDGAAGGVAGMVGGMLRGPRNIIPGIAVFSVLAGGLSYGANLFSSPESVQRRAEKEKQKTSWVDSKWSPMKRLSNEDYEKRLEEQILRLDADIAIVDERIAALKASKESDAKKEEGEVPTP